MSSDFYAAYRQMKLNETKEGVTRMSKIVSLAKLLGENNISANKKDLIKLSKKIIDTY